MRYLSLFSGIEAASVAWEPLGWEPVAFAELEPFPSAVLEYHYPNVPNLGDVTKVDWDEFNRANGPIDAIVFGSPCQSFSVAGRRLGLDDPRGNLALYALDVVRRIRPRWFLFENVPGLLSSDGGRDFGSFLWTVGECGYQCSWRILDAQYWGVAQRRKRLFVVGHIGDWRPPAAVLFEPESLRGDSAPCREAGERVADSLTVGANQYSGFCGEPVAHALTGEGFDASEDGTGRGTPLVPHTAQCLNAGAMGRQDAETETLIASAFDARQSDVIQYGNMAGPLDTDGHSQAVAFTASEQANSYAWERPFYPTLTAQQPSETSNLQTGVRQGMSVRRLTPRECERLQGFPDDYTAIPYRGKTASDGPRYKALGNSMAVPVVRWIGERIAAVQSEIVA